MTVTDRTAFDLEITEQPSCKVFHMKGRLMDQQQADRLMASLDAEIGAGNHRVVLDMSQLQYMNSTGLNILINVLTRTRNAGGDAILAGPTPGVRQLFTVTKLDSVFIITDDVAQAVARVNA